MIKDILAKYENFYVGGSGYTFQVEVDDFNELLRMITELEEANKELGKEIVEHCETKGLAGRQVFALTKRVDELVVENIGLKSLAKLKDDLAEKLKEDNYPRGFQEEYLSDTIGILVSYDNENTVEGLKKLIDETRERLIKIKRNTITKEDFGR